MERDRMWYALHNLPERGPRCRRVVMTETTSAALTVSDADDWLNFPPEESADIPFTGNNTRIHGEQMESFLLRT
ncbi:hypothetical protein IRJ41_007587 [Triplophysa rosa]|uniref:Uncharacterized protein n=1 Tax=Triplophysa rosa TaxID=992332 RepID=A0A9W8C920_TRIRA|nr:hypothetical protein IRJ41_007587 [Triplophysa rosa]